MLPLKDNIPSYRKPVINYILIGINTLVFIYELSFRESYLLEKFIFSYGMVPLKFITDFTSSWYTIFTSLFLHGGILHFGGNMLFLYIFGDNVEDRLGHIKYFFTYIFWGVVGSLLQLVFNPTSNIPMIGASGCISGVLGCYFIFYPTAGIVTLVPLGFFSRIIVIPAFFFLGLWFLIQLYSGGLSIVTQPILGRSGGIAYWAHIGGFISGVITARMVLRKRRRTYWRYL